MKYTKRQIKEAIAHWKNQLRSQSLNESSSYSGTVYTLCDEMHDAAENLGDGLAEVDKEIKSGNLEGASEAIDHAYNLYYDLAKFFGL